MHFIDKENSRNDLTDPLGDVLIHNLKNENLLTERSMDTLLISSRSFWVISVLFGFIMLPIIDTMSCPPFGLAFAYE